MHKQILPLLALFLGLILTGCAGTGATPADNALSPPAAYPQAQSLYPAIDALAEKLVASMAGRQAGQIAVADFVGPGSEIHVLGELVADKLGVRLFASGAFSGYMERKQLKELIRAQAEERQSGYFDQETVKELGRMIGVGSMVIGSIEDLGNVVDVTARIVESGSGQVLGMADVQIIKDATVNNILRQRRTATLTVNVDPPVGGTVNVAGRNASLVNGMATLSGIPYGQCAIIIQPNGHEPVRRSIPIRAENETFGVRLEIKQYDVSFTIIPPDAVLIVDGNPVPLNKGGFGRVADLVGEEHTYVITSEGFETRAETFNPAASVNILVNLQTNDPLYDTKKKFFEKVKAIQGKESFGIQLWTNQAAYRIGDAIEFYFKTDRDCYLVLVDIASNGEIRQIFPNRYHRDNFVRAGKTHRIPDESYGFGFEVEPPSGTERIYAVASSQRLDLFGQDYDQSGFQVLTRSVTPVSRVRSIGVTLNQSRIDAASEHVIQINR